jgi:site-specific recombinase XerD
MDWRHKLAQNNSLRGLEIFLRQNPLAVTILRAGGTLTDAQGVFRHANPSTTQIYTRTIEEEIRIRNAPEELIDRLY